mmetsp:Transcript_35994/g.84035  ORF Transcript_35994/g.84035 Transcript_35994/m.84035 type:complete len:479 (-) Transcript_35994:38-1474(-)
MADQQYHQHTASAISPYTPGGTRSSSSGSGRRRTVTGAASGLILFDRTLGAIFALSLSLLIAREMDYWFHRTCGHLKKETLEDDENDSDDEEKKYSPTSRCINSFVHLVMWVSTWSARKGRSSNSDDRDQSKGEIFRKRFETMGHKHQATEGEPSEECDEISFSRAIRLPGSEDVLRGSCHCRSISFSIVPSIGLDSLPVQVDDANNATDEGKCSFPYITIDTRSFHLDEEMHPKKKFSATSESSKHMLPFGVYNICSRNDHKGRRRGYVFCKRCGVHVFRVRVHSENDDKEQEPFMKKNVLEINFRCIDVSEKDIITDTASDVRPPAVLDSLMPMNDKFSRHGHDKAISLSVNTTTSTEDISSSSVSAESSSIGSGEACLAGDQLFLGIFQQKGTEGDDTEDSTENNVIQRTKSERKKYVRVDSDLQKRLVQHMSRHLELPRKGNDEPVMDSPTGVSLLPSPTEKIIVPVIEDNSLN